MFDRALTFNLTLFQSDYDDLQESSTVFEDNQSIGRTVVGNVASSRSRGIELTGSLRAAPGLTLSSDVSYLDAIYLSYESAPCTVLQAVQFAGAGTCVQDLSGKRRAYAPEFSGNVSADYRTRITEALELKLNCRMFFTSSYFSQPLADPYLSQAGYISFDARLGFGASDGTWEVALLGKNLTNKLQTSFRQPIPSSIGSYQAVIEPTRSIGIQLKAEY